MEVMMKRPSVTEEEASITVSVPEEGDHARKSDQLQSTREEIVEMKQENERLKTVLAKIMNDYRSLQTHLSDVVNKGHAEEPPETAEGDREAEETELVSLSLGTSSWRQVKKEKKSEQVKGDEEDLSLGLGTRSNSSHENSFEDGKEEEIGELWPPSKALKAVRSGEDEVPENLHVKKARVSVRARCDAPTMNDGCQWRKYGQKIAKGNPCPRAYYRCTISPGCPVRKQVQRCADDMSILITTYEGIHNHPLPMAATSMASTTSAAAGMLVSGPSPSPPSIPAAAMVCSGGASGATYPGLNFSFLDDPRQKMTYIPNASISSSPSQATITLDLTSPSPSSQSRFPSNPSQHANPHWNSPLLSYGSQIFNSKPLMGSLSTGSQQPRETFYHPYTQRPAQTQIPLPDTIAAATKAITADPGFQTALAAAITSAVGGKSTQGMADTLLKNFRWGERLSAASNPSSSPGRNGSH